MCVCVFLYGYVLNIFLACIPTSSFVGNVPVSKTFAEAFSCYSIITVFFLFCVCRGWLCCVYDWQSYGSVCDAP